MAIPAVGGLIPLRFASTPHVRHVGAFSRWWCSPSDLQSGRDTWQPCQRRYGSRVECLNRLVQEFGDYDLFPNPDRLLPAVDAQHQHFGCDADLLTAEPFPKRPCDRNALFAQRMT